MAVGKAPAVPAEGLKIWSQPTPKAGHGHVRPSAGLQNSHSMDSLASQSCQVLRPRFSKTPRLKKDGVLSEHRGRTMQPPATPSHGPVS